MMDDEGLFQTAKQKEAHYDWIMSGQEAASGRMNIAMLLDERKPQTLEELERYADGIGETFGLEQKDVDMAKSQWAERQFRTSQRKHMKLMSQANEDGSFDDPELTKRAQQAYKKYQESLVYAPLDVRSDLTRLATLAKNPRGEFDPDQIKGLGQQFEQVMGAFGGNMAEALQAYYPGDVNGNKDMRGRLVTMKLLADINGGSWQKGYKQAVEQREAGPSAEHSSWQDKESYNDLMQVFEDSYPAEYKAQLKTYLKSLKGAPMGEAFTAAVGLIESDYTAVEKSGWSGDEFRLKGFNGKKFLSDFRSELKKDPDMGPWVDENGNVDQYKEPYAVLKEFVEVKAGEWERQLSENHPGLDIELNDAGEAFTEEGSIIVKSHPRAAGALEIKHRSGLVLAGQVTPQDIIRRIKEIPSRQRNREDGSKYLFERY
jgi:hypothetical protein